MMSSDSASKLADVLPNRRRHRAPSAPCIPWAVVSTERYSTPALPPSSGWTQSISGRRQDRPYRSRPSPARNCEPTAIGWIAEQWSCSRPGMIASLLRVPPPISSAASRTVTWRPALARATPAARPFGPAPTTIALLMPRLPLAPVLARSLLRSSLALGFGCSCLASHSLRSSLVPCCDPHSRSASGAHASPPTRCGPRSFLAAILTRARLRVLMPRLPLAAVLARSLLRSSLALGFGCSCLPSHSLRSSLVPCCDPHSRSASGARHAIAP